MKITASDLAQRLTGNEYGLEVSEAETRVAKENGLVIVYGYSDDNMEFEGAIHDEVGCYNGGKAFISKSGEVYTDDGSVPEDAQQNVIEAIWCDLNTVAAWVYRTDIPHETFNIYEDGELFCIGLVFSMEDLK